MVDGKLCESECALCGAEEVEQATAESDAVYNYVCVLPAGVGTDITVLAELYVDATLTYRNEVLLLSYASPSITSIVADGCESGTSNAELVNCPRGEKPVLTYVVLSLSCACC